MGRSGDQIDGRADLYSLGVVIYEMLTGKQPFESDTAMGLLMHHLQTVPPPPHLLRPDLNIPPAISKVLMKALEKDPAERFQNANEMLEALAAAKKQAVAQTGIATKVITPTVMAATSIPVPDSTATMPMSATSTPTYTPTVAAAVLSPTAAAPKYAPVPVDETVAIAPPRKTPAPAPRVAPRAAPPAADGRRWLVPLVVAVLVAGGLAVVAHQRQKASAAAPAPVVQQVVNPAEPAPEPTPAVQQTAAPAQQNAAANPDKPRRPAHEKPASEAASKREQHTSAPDRPSMDASATAPAPQQQRMDPGVNRLLTIGKQQYDNGKYGQAMATFRSALELDPNNEWAKRGIEACKRARQQQSEQILQSDQAQSQQSDQQGNQNVPRWRRRRE